MTKITALEVVDWRYPTSLHGDGSDAVHKDPDVSLLFPLSSFPLPALFLPTAGALLSSRHRHAPPLWADASPPASAIHRGAAVPTRSLTRARAVLVRVRHSQDRQPRAARGVRPHFHPGPRQRDHRPDVHLNAAPHHRQGPRGRYPVGSHDFLAHPDPGRAAALDRTRERRACDGVRSHPQRSLGPVGAARRQAPVGDGRRHGARAADRVH